MMPMSLLLPHMIAAAANRRPLLFPARLARRPA
jgi:hypothetical protein